MNNLMLHYKWEHRDKAQLCKNKDICSYQNCWFRHDKYDEQNQVQHGVTENILNIMEKIAHRIVNLENSLNK